MDALKNLAKTLGSKSFWLHALAILVGFKASDLISAVAAKAIPQLPEKAVPFVGPAVVVAVAPFTGREFGPYLMLGAGLNVVDSLLGMVGVPQASIRQE